MLYKSLTKKMRNTCVMPYASTSKQEKDMLERRTGQRTLWHSKFSSTGSRNFLMQIRTDVKALSCGRLKLLVGLVPDNTTASETESKP